MSSLSGILSEPPDGTWLVLFNDTDASIVIHRDDSRNPEVATAGARWYEATGFEGEEPRSWDYIMTTAVQAYALGDLLAEVEADR